MLLTMALLAMLGLLTTLAMHLLQSRLPHWDDTSLPKMRVSSKLPLPEYARSPALRPNRVGMRVVLPGGGMTPVARGRTARMLHRTAH